MHVPAGAIPKDGPSAGVTMVTALASLLTGRPVKHTVGMTGEVTLQGRVLPIGGVKQKVLAAHAAGLTDVILPERNRGDLDDVPADVREQMTFHFAMSRRRGARGGARAGARARAGLTPPVDRPARRAGILTAEPARTTRGARRDQGGTVMSGLRRLLAALCRGALPHRARRTVGERSHNRLSRLDGGDRRVRHDARSTPAKRRTDCPRTRGRPGPTRAVNSIYLRIRAVHPAIEGNVYNDAVGGEQDGEPPDQIEVAIGQRVEFVIVDMGGNDICAPNEAAVTSAESFRADFEAAIDRAQKDGRTRA